MITNSIAWILIIGAAQRRLAAHILSHPEDNTPARLLALARAELSGP